MGRPNRKHLMQNLSPRHVMTEESRRLGVESGWYSTKVSGTCLGSASIRSGLPAPDRWNQPAGSEKEDL